MLRAMRHRSPYGELWGGGRNEVFGFRYQDDCDRGRLRAVNTSLRIWVVVDGEIFSLPPNLGSNWRSFSDAETILELYRKKGEACFESIDGSYSVALWDENERKLILGRDRLGYKPLFYHCLKDGIVFASEIKAIIAGGSYAQSLNLCGLNYFLSYGYTPNPETLFQGIRQVKPGHLLIWKNGIISEKPYWKFTYGKNKGEASDRYYRERFLELFESAVLKRLRRHPDCGAFLSGGLDTGGVVAMMHKLKSKPFKVFTAGFKEERFNEIADAKILVKLFGLDHHTVIVEFDKDFPTLLEKIVWHHDAPFADTSAIPSYFAAKLAKEHVDTVLTGDFPDQLIGGSGHHVAALARLKQDPLIFRMLRDQVLNRLVRKLGWSAGSGSLIDKAKRMLYRETFPLEEQRIILSMPVPPLLKRCLYSSDLLKISEENDALNVAAGLYEEVKGEDLLNKLLYFDMLSYAPDDLMVKVERMTMAHGLNAISPFHDLELVEFIASVPSHLKINGTIRKYVMREALRPLLPEHTLNKKKQGFAMPIGEWFVTKMPDYVRDVLLAPKTIDRGYFNKKFMKKMVEDFLAGKTDYASGNEATIISLITLELWHRIFIDN